MMQRFDAVGLPAYVILRPKGLATSTTLSPSQRRIPLESDD
jgi:hypothetical protein